MNPNPYNETSIITSLDEMLGPESKMVPDPLAIKTKIIQECSFKITREELLKILKSHLYEYYGVKSTENMVLVITADNINLKWTQHIHK